MAVDLHLHTHYSDGSWSPAELVERALSLKLKCIAITDHDTTDGVEEAVLAAQNRIEIIPAVEMNTVWSGEDGEEIDVHILGYFLDRDNSRLRTALAIQQAARLTLVEDTLGILSGLGIDLSLAEVKKHAGRGSIGRPHITKAIVEAGGARNVSEAYEKFMTRGCEHYVRRKSLSPYEAVEAISAAGGIASIAHPGRSITMERIILSLKKHGLKAVEAYHRRHSLDVVRHYIRFAHRHGLTITGGSDCHGPYEQFPGSIGTISIPLQVVEALRSLTNR